jgi:transketolase N-terminal domain/subunit
MSTTSATTAPMSGLGLNRVAELAAQLRVDSIRSSTSAGSGHPTSSMSAADLLTLAWAGIDVDHIACAAHRLLDGATGAPA